MAESKADKEALLHPFSVEINNNIVIFISWISSYRSSTHTKQPHAHRMISVTEAPFWMKCSYMFVHKWITQKKKIRILQPQVEHFAVNKSFDDVGRGTPVRFPVTGFPLLSSSVQTTAKLLFELSSS